MRGLFSPRPRAIKLLTAVDADRAHDARSCETSARKHRGQGVRLLGGRIVVLWGEDAIGEVLDRSADVYASGSGAKAKGMYHFQPDALTLSHGEEWKDRRALHRVGAGDVGEAAPGRRRASSRSWRDEVSRLSLDGAGELEWSQFERAVRPTSPCA